MHGGKGRGRKRSVTEEREGRRGEGRMNGERCDMTEEGGYNGGGKWLRDY